MRRVTLLAIICYSALSSLRCMAADATVKITGPKIEATVTGFADGSCRVVLEKQDATFTVNVNGTLAAGKVTVVSPEFTKLDKNSQYRLTIRSKVDRTVFATVKLKTGGGDPATLVPDDSTPTDRQESLSVASALPTGQQGVSAGDSGLSFEIGNFVEGEAGRLRIQFQAADSNRTASATALSNMFGNLANEAKSAMEKANGNTAVAKSTADDFRAKIRSGVDAVYAARIGAKTDWKPVLIAMENRINQIAELAGATPPAGYKGSKLKLDQIDHLAVLFTEIHDGFAKVAKAEDQHIEDLAKLRAQQIVAGFGTGSMSSSSLSRSGCNTCRSKRCCGCRMLLLGP